MTDDNRSENLEERDPAAKAETLELDTKLCTVDSLLTERESPLGRHFARLVARDASDDE
jgi:hypothetical protein